MPATPLPKATRFFQPGTIAVLWLPAIAATNLTPTQVEIDAGTDLTGELTDWAGWSYSTTFIETRDASTPVSPKLAGRISVDDSSITFNGSEDGNDVRNTFTRGQNGYIVIADAGMGTGKKAEVFPVEVGSVNKARSLDSDPFKVRVDFGVTNVPQDVTLP
jgi:hypothetical protein